MQTIFQPRGFLSAVHGHQYNRTVGFGSQDGSRLVLITIVLPQRIKLALAGIRLAGTDILRNSSWIQHPRTCCHGLFLSYGSHHWDIDVYGIAFPSYIQTR